MSIVAKILLPLIEELFDRMVGCKYFTLLDLAHGYHQMVVLPSSRPYTAFRAQKETYQWCVAPMGLSGMPGVWSRLMRTLFDKLGEFVVVYLNDICVFSRTMEVHVKDIRAVCEVLRKEKLYARLSKCAFGRKEIAFLGHMVSEDVLRVDPKRTDTIATFQAPTCRKDLLSFVGLAGYYRRFICNFAQISRPLRDLIKQDTQWNWGEDQQKAFNALKIAFQQSPTLKLPYFTHPFIVTTDASGFCMSGVLSQRINKNDHAIAFYSKHLGPLELKWPAHEKGVLAIKTALEKWRPYLHGRHFSVYTDNSACKWMLHHPMVSPKMTRMLMFFSQFDFVLHHVKGRSNVVADALSRPTASGEHSTDTDVPTYPVPDMSHVVHDCTDDCNLHFNLLDRQVVHSSLIQYIALDVSQLLLDVVELRGEIRSIGVAQEQIHNAGFHVVRAHLSKEVRKAIQQGYSKDKVFKNIWKTKQSNNNFIIDKELIYLKQDEAMQQVCIPDIPELNTKILYEFHDSATAAHPGVR
uniref:Polyprotein putative n=1 Tax=Albugo laibachii Nc14 TaxID=890382 RepID=F0X1I7_9STRA|nr:polyprotein putative [Albugo laibachii Nc14]|eukprot:CCA27674.1 polyprotein putative [Albugo laibachii Nc14]